MKCLKNILVFFSLFLLLSSCVKKEAPNDNPKITIEIEVDGERVGEMRSNVAEAKGIGEVKGGGSYHHGDKVTIQATVYPNSKYKLYSLYEKAERGGFTKERGLVNETVSGGGYSKVKNTSCSLTFAVSEDMTFVAKFVSKDDLEDESITIGDVVVKDVEKNPNVVNVIATENGKE